MKVSQIDLTFVPEDDDGARSRASMSGFERDFDRSESQLQHDIIDSQQSAHDRLMLRLRRGTVRVQTKLDRKATEIHPLTRRPSVVSSKQMEQENQDEVLDDY